MRVVFSACLIVSLCAMLIACGHQSAASSEVAATSTPADAHASTHSTHTHTKGPTVKVHVFNDEGQLIGPVDSPKVEKTDDQWRAQLTDEQYRIARQAGTERAGTGALLKNKADGVYACVACGLPLFDAGTKFESGTGWPSFYKPIAETNVAERRDTSHGMVRVEALCPRCEAHLGHVFPDGPRPTGLRYCLNSASLTFVDKADVSTLADPAARGAGETAAEGATAAADGDHAVAVFAGGCFWCTEAVFEPVAGVIGVESGYAGGTAQTANYQDVSSGATDHAEVIRIVYDPARVSYDKLLEIFFTVAHDPTQLNRQGPDRGRQYRSAVFYADEAQRQAAESYIRELEASGKYSDPIVTTLEPLHGYYPAEGYHQDFVQKNPTHGYIVQQALPKVQKLYDKFGDAVNQPAEK